MSAPYKASFALAPSNTSILPGSLCNDLLIWTGNSNQNILFGVSNVNTYMSVSGSGNMSLSGNVAFSNQLQLSGIMLTQRTSAFTNNVTSAITALQGFAYVNGDVQITMSNVQSNAIRFIQNSTEYMRISSNGFVGIGTSTPTVTLDVNGNIKFNNGALVISSNNSTIGFLTTAASTGSYANNATSGDLILRSQFNNVHIVPNQQTLGSSILCACSNGYVGISTANPGYPLDVNGIVKSSSYLIVGTGTGYTNTNSYPGIFVASTSTQNAVIVGDTLTKGGFTLGFDQSDNKFKIQVGGGLGSGNFTAPNLIITSSNITTNGSFTGTGDNTCIATYGTNLGFVKKAGAATVIGYNNINPFKISMMSQADISTGISTATLTDRLIIDNSGYVGIGATPSYKLDISSTGATGLSGTGYYIVNNSSTLMSTANYGLVVLRAQGDIVASGVVGTYSDKRIKNIDSLYDDSNDLDIIDQINVVRFKYKDPIIKGTGIKIGFIAQEVGKILPDQIRFDKEYIPDIFKIPDNVEGSLITLLNHGLTKGIKLKIYNSDNKEHFTTVTNILSVDKFEIENPISDQLFIYGREIDDLQVLEHNSLFALAFNGVKQLHTKLKEKNNEIKNLHDIIDTLITRINKIENKLNL
jgi:hypothetical protein